MKILQRGTPPAEAVHTGICHTCNTEVEFARSEGKITYDQRDGDFVTVKCPVCGASIHSQITYGSLRLESSQTTRPSSL